MDFDPPSPYPIVGVQAGWDSKDPTRTRPLRREADNWFGSTAQQDQDQVYLFVHALLKFQSADNKQKLSFFQIAGIHGLPLIPWDENTKSETPGRGYCTHFSVLFPTWHRPYVLLYEQVLYSIMKQDIISGGSWDSATKDRLNKAADTWRMPYWDWAAKTPDMKTGSYTVPKIAYGETIQIVGPNGKTETPQNPMYRYNAGAPFKDFGVVYDNKKGDGVYGNCKATSRWSKTTDGDGWINGSVDNSLVVEAISNPQAGDWPQNIHSLSDAVYRLFTTDYTSNYASFATAAWDPDGTNKDYTSLENIHGNIHGYTGGFDQFPTDSDTAAGHMAHVPVAGFDPIFFMHHCNVDRILAIWQTLFPAPFSPNYWFDTTDQELKDGGTWSIKPQNIDTPDTPLAPFHKDSSGKYYTSNDVRSWFHLGYTYPELQPWDPKHQENGHFSPEKYLSNVRAAVTNLYDQGTAMFLTPSVPRAEQPSGIIAQVTQAAQTVISKPITEKTQYDYIVNVLFDRFHFGGRPYLINIYFDKVKVGDVYNFSAPPDALGRSDGGCENCKRQIEEGTQATGQVPITRALWLSPNVDESSDEAITAYLTKHLRWTVLLDDGTLVPESDYHFLKVSVAKGEATHFADEQQLSYFRDYDVVHEITQAKPGGARPE